MNIEQVATMVLLVAVAGALVILVIEMRTARLRWSRVSPWGIPYHGFPVYELWEIIDAAERRSQVTLTWGARQMLIIPVVETIELRGRVDWREVQLSIDDIVRTMAEGDVPLPSGRLASSVSVIHAFFSRFCSIPPFCSRREEQGG